MSDKILDDDYNEEQSYPNSIPPFIASSSHPHARLGDPQAAPGPGRTFTPDELAAIENFAKSNSVQGTAAQHAAYAHANRIDPNQPPPPPVRTFRPAQGQVPQPQAQQAPAQPQRPPQRPQATPAPSQPPRTMRFEPTPPVPTTPTAPPMQPGAESGYAHQFQPQQVPVNPLAGYQRMPGLSIRLPSDGRYLPPGSIEFTMDGKVLVYPMRAADEILMKSPDALMNGFAVECLLQSCVPGIKYPRMISNPDLDVLFLAIKAASTGNEMEIEYDCPVCSQHSGLELDLRSYLETAITELPDNAVQLNDRMTVYIRPYNLHNATQMSLAAYNEARAIQTAEANGDAEKQMVVSYKNMTDLDVMMTADCVLQIVVPEGVVNDKKQIMEFIPTLSERELKKISDLLTQMNGSGLDKSTPVECYSCRHQWTTQAEFDPASFFAVNS